MAGPGSGGILWVGTWQRRPLKSLIVRTCMKKAAAMTHLAKHHHHHHHQPHDQEAEGKKGKLQLAFKFSFELPLMLLRRKIEILFPPSRSASIDTLAITLSLSLSLSLTHTHTRHTHSLCHEVKTWHMHRRRFFHLVRIATIIEKEGCRGVSEADSFYDLCFA